MMDCSGILVAMDQHAADERVRLEDLRARLLVAVAAGAGRESCASVPAQPSAGHLRRHGRSATVHSTCAAAAIAAAVGSCTEGMQTVEAAAPMRMPVDQPAELLSSETTAHSPSGGLSDSEWHLYEAYRDQAERCVHAYILYVHECHNTLCASHLLTHLVAVGGAGVQDRPTRVALVLGASPSWRCHASSAHC